MLPVIDNPTPEQVVQILLESADSSDEGIAIRLSRPLGPSRFVQMSMVPDNVVHAIWPDEGAPYGYSHRIVSGQAYAEDRHMQDRLAFRVPDAESADVLARIFGDGREPGPNESWCITLLVRDRTGGTDEHGRPKFDVIYDERFCV